MNKFPSALALLASSLMLGACSHIQFYADSDHELISSASITQLQPTQVRVSVRFFSDGKRVDRAEVPLKKYVDNALNQTSVLRPTDDPKAPATLYVEVEDISASGEQPNGDFLFSGMTIGRIPVSRITDRYEFKLRYRMANGHQRFGHDKHGIWTSVGELPAPSLRGPYTSSERAFKAVVTDVVLTFLKNVTLTDTDADSVIFVQDDPEP